MRSPVLIAETPFAAGHGPRFLAPPGRGVDAAAASYYVGRLREDEDDVEEIEGDDYLAVRLTRTDEASGDTAPEILVLAGVDVDRMSGEERDEVLEQLRERLEVLADAVAAVDWAMHGYEPVIEIPELEEWHEAGWDALPRLGPWAEDSVDAAPAPYRTEPEPEPEPEPERESSAVSDDHEDSPPPEPEEIPRPWEESRAEERVEDAGEDYRSPPEPEPEPEPIESHDPGQPEPAAATSTSFASEPAPDDEEDEPRREEEAEAGRVSLETPAPAPTEPETREEPAPSIQVFEEPAKPVVATHEPPGAAAPAPAIDPIRVFESMDHSPALAPLPVRPADPEPAAGSRPRRRVRWWVWGPWVAVAVLLVAKYVYLSQIDRTWNQRVTETRFVTGPTRVVEKVIERPVEKIVEKVVEKPGSGPTGETPKTDQWTKFEAEYRGRVGRGELVAAADLLTAWKPHLPAWGEQTPPHVTALRKEYEARAAQRLGEWTAGRARDRRFADAYTGLAAFAAADSVKGLLNQSAADLVVKARADVRAAEDEYHYTQIRTLLTADPVPEDRLKQHVDAYLALVEPPGRMLAEVQQVADYQKWLKEGRPVKAVVTVEWGPRSAVAEHRLEIGLGAGPDGRPQKTITRPADARPGRIWTETFPVAGEPAAAYQIKTVRPASPVEELAEGTRELSEVFASDPHSRSREPASGTKVTVQWQGLLARPTLPAWTPDRTPVPSVSLPKVGP